MISSLSAARTTLIVADGTTGLGSNLVIQGKVAGYDNIIFGANCDESELPSELAAAGRCFPVDPNMGESAQAFHTFTEAFRDKSQQLVMIANTKPRFWFQAFANEFQRPGRGNYLVGLGSIVAAEEAGKLHDRAYLDAKIVIKFVTTEIKTRVPYLQSLALIPGIVDTPETRADTDVIVRLLFGALKLFNTDTIVGDPLPAGLEKLGEALGLREMPKGRSLSRADILQRVFEGGNSRLPSTFPSVLSISRNRDLVDNGKNARIAQVIRQDSILCGRIINILREADIVVEPHWVAHTLFKQLETGMIPPDRRLKVYSEFTKPEDAPILRLLPSIV